MTSFNENETPEESAAMIFGLRVEACHGKNGC